MTGWHLIAGYLLIGVMYLIGSFVAQVVGSLSRPPLEGHLDVRFKLRRLERWFVSSAILLVPIAITYAGHASHYYDNRLDRLERTNTMLIMYVIIALAWIIKLQLQINKISDQNNDCSHAISCGVNSDARSYIRKLNDSSQLVVPSVPKNLFWTTASKQFRRCHSKPSSLIE